MDWSFFNNVWFWTIMLGIGVLAYGVIRPITKRLPIINRKVIIYGSIAGILFTSGIIGQLGFGSVAKSTDTVNIVDLQVTTAFAGNGSHADDTIIDDLHHIRLTDAQAVETAGSYELSTGIITVFRQGNLDPTSCPVVCSTTEGYAHESSPDGTQYTILEETSTHELECYLNAQKSGSGAAATTSSPKERTVLEFDEGISKAHLGVALEVDEEGHDALAQYSYRDVIVNICGKPYTFRITNMD
jgi:hypothetical protein